MCLPGGNLKTDAVVLPENGTGLALFRLIRNDPCFILTMIRRLLSLVFVLTLLVSGFRAEPIEPVEKPDLQATTVEGSVLAPDSANLRLFEEVMDYARQRNLHTQPIGKVMQEIGLFFRGKPYVAGMLDVPEEETLICRLDGFDCVTFVETTLALARGVTKEDYSYDTFTRNVEDLRYRNGNLDGYCSRLHYFSDWIHDNELRGSLTNITRQLGGNRYEKRIDFMSTHRTSYPRFATNDSLYQCILEAEKQLQEMYLYYIPQENIRSIYDELQAGDIVATATSIKGLDVTHTGLVYDGGSGKGLLHASTSGGVKISPDLQSYIQNNKSQIGIIVIRPNNLSSE